MGTRSLIHIHLEGKDSEILTTIYRQFDGYPSVGGNDLKDAGNMIILNGYNFESAGGTHANGMGCYAAQLIGSLKNGAIGGFYIYPAGVSDCGEEYTYHLWEDQGIMHISVDGYQKWEGPLADFDGEEIEASYKE